jgi:hypothetical protein
MDIQSSTPRTLVAKRDNLLRTALTTALQVG